MDDDDTWRLLSSSACAACDWSSSMLNTVVSAFSGGGAVVRAAASAASFAAAIDLRVRAITAENRRTESRKTRRLGMRSKRRGGLRETFYRGGASRGSISFGPTRARVFENPSPRQSCPNLHVRVRSSLPDSRGTNSHA